MAQADYVPILYSVQITDASLSPSTNPLRAAHLRLLGWLAAHPPAPIPINVHPADLEGRADQLRELLSRISAYLRLLLEDAARHVPSELDLRQIEALLADLASEVAGTLRNATRALEGWQS
jgi:hypothetical protein